MSDSGRQDVGTMEGTENREDLSPLPEDVSTDEPATAEVPVNEIDIKHDTKAAQESIEASLREEIAKLQQCCQEKDALIEKLNQTIADQRSAQSDDQSKFEARIKQVQLDSIRKENISNMKLSLKIQEAQEYLAKIDALNQTRVPSSTQLQSYLLDPTLNYLFERMRTEVDQAKSRVEEMQNEMAAWKFSADSNTGKQLMAKCRLLHQENQELGKMITSGTIAKLESGLAIHKNFSEDLKKSQAGKRIIVICLDLFTDC